MSIRTLLEKLSDIERLLLYAALLILSFIIAKFRKEKRKKTVLNFKNVAPKGVRSFQACSLLASSEYQPTSLLHKLFYRIILPLFGSIIVVGFFSGAVYIALMKYIPTLQKFPQIFLSFAFFSLIILFRKVYINETKRQNALDAVNGREIVFTDQKLRLYKEKMVSLKDFSPLSYWQKSALWSLELGQDLTKDWKYIDLPYETIAGVWVSEGVSSEGEGETVIDMVVVCRKISYRISRGLANDEAYRARLEILLSLFKENSVAIHPNNLHLV